LLQASGKKCPLVPLLSYSIKENFYLGRIEGFSFQGLQAFFRSNDHRPPHFHVKKPGSWEIRVYILTSSKNRLDYSFKFPKNNSVILTSQQEKAIFDFVASNREKLLSDWQTQVCVKEKMSDEP
jgi:hypothetical protein